jgi:dephospho-CoA kinase
MKRHIIGLAGEMASGKSTAANHLIHKYNATSHKFSTPLRDTLDRFGLPQTRGNLAQLSTKMRETFGEDLFAKVLYQDTQKDQSEYIVVDGVRRLADIEHLRKLPEFKLVYIKADPERRFGRITNRTENEDDQGKSYEDFQKEQVQEAELEIKSLEPHADVVIENDGTIEELFEEVDRVMES